jgi:hypothetical protein
MLIFINLFEISNQREWSVFKTLRNNNIKLTFRRNFGPREETEWESLTNILDGITLNQKEDSAMWVLEKSKEYSTSSLYNALTFPGIVNRWMMNIWKVSLLLKLRFFCGKFAMIKSIC